MSTWIVVGHGKSLEGAELGDYINQCDGVVRMWNCHWQDANDFGKRYDYGLFELAPKLYNTFTSHLNSDSIPLPDAGWIALYLKGAMPTNLPTNTKVIYQDKWVAVGKRLGGLGETGRLRLTRGTIAACWILSVIQPSRLVLAGFDNIYRGKALSIKDGFTDAYINSSGIFGWESYKPDQIKMGNHDLAVERGIINNLSLNRNVEVLFSQDL